MVSYEDSSKVEIKTKTMIYTIVFGPRNFYYITPNKGMVPQALKGAFTTIPAAEKAVRNYLLHQGKEEL